VSATHAVARSLTAPTGGNAEARFPRPSTGVEGAGHPSRQGHGATRLPHMFTSVIHAAAPHNDTMNMGFSWEGVEARRRRASTPKPSAREGDGETRFPHFPTAVGSGWRLIGRGAVRQAHRRWGNPVSPYVHLSRPCGCAAQRHDEHGFFLGGRSPPKPSAREGDGETRFPHFPTAVGGAWHPGEQTLGLCPEGAL